MTLHMLFLLLETLQNSAQGPLRWLPQASQAEVSCPFLSMPQMLCISLISTEPDEGFTGSLESLSTPL